MKSALVSLLLLLVLQEVALRAVFPRREIANFDRIHYSPLNTAQEGRDTGSLAHASFRWDSEPDGTAFVHHLNLYGFRDAEWRVAPDPGALRLLVLGDSFVVGDVFSSPMSSLFGTRPIATTSASVSSVEPSERWSV